MTKPDQKITLDMNPEIVCSIIEKSREFHAKEEIMIPEEPSDAGSDWATQILADYRDDSTYQELEILINDLEPDQQITLVALMWIGRGDYEISEWENAYAEAKRNWNERTATYLLSKPQLSDYLEDALAQFGYSCEQE